MTTFLVNYLNKCNCLSKCHYSFSQADERNMTFFIAEAIPDDIESFIEESVNVSTISRQDSTLMIFYISLDRIVYASSGVIDRLLDFIFANQNIEHHRLGELPKTCPLVLGWPSEHLKEILDDKLKLRKRNLWICDREYNTSLIGHKLSDQVQKIFDEVYKAKAIVPDAIAKNLGWKDKTKRQAISTQLSRLYEINLLWRRKLTKNNPGEHEFKGSWTYEYSIPIIKEENNLSLKEFLHPLSG